jgi:hypothetical protein
MRHDRDRAAQLYAELRPYADHVLVLAWGVVCLGAADRYLGMLASTDRRWDDAQAHFAKAIDIETTLGAPPLLARTHHWYALMRLDRDSEGDRSQAAASLEISRSEASRLGMKRLETDSRCRLEAQLT